MIALTLEQLRLQARNRPPSYIRDVIAHASISDEHTVYLTPEAYQVLRNRYAEIGPGTELRKLLAGWPFYIVSSPTCKCNARARYMDEKGCDWCESPEGMAEILGFLRDAATERGLPFIDMAARLLVRRAIANARKAEARRAQRPPHHDRREAMAPPSDAAQG
jgi:hypothetical protein